jgi:hypothetical protein
MAYNLPPDASASVRTSYEFAKVTRNLPQVPIAPGVGSTALRRVGEGVRLTGMGLWSPQDFAEWPARMGEEDLAAIRTAAAEEHEPRHLRVPPDSGLRRAAGFVTTSLLTTVTELARPGGGHTLPNIHKPTDNDPNIAAAVSFLNDPTNRDTVTAVFDTAAHTIATDTRAAGVVARYRADITGIAHEHGLPMPGSPEFFQMQDSLNRKRARVASDVGDLIYRDLDQLQIAGVATVDGREVAVDLTPRQVDVATANLTRWEPVPEWFAPPPQA